MKVYVVTRGEDCEGQDPVSVHLSREGAREKARALAQELPFAGEEPGPNDHADFFQAGCDIVAVIEFEVEE